MALAAFVLGLFGIVVAILAGGLHQVPEGHVAMYWFGGALTDTMNDPGWHWQFPLVYTRDFVQLTLQTDTVTNVPCGTSTGVIITFDRIDVVNQLDRNKAHSTIKRFGVQYDRTFVFDKIAHRINEICSQATLHEVYISRFSSLDEELASALQETCDKFDTGLSVVSIRVTKPRIPDSVRRNYEEVERATSALLVAAREQEVSRKVEETERMKQTMAATRDAEIAVIQAEREANVTIIDTRKRLAAKEGEQRMEAIHNAMTLARRKAETDAAHYAIVREAEATNAKLTEAYLRYTLFTSLANSTKIYFGEKIPTIFSDLIGATHLTNLKQRADGV